MIFLRSVLGGLIAVVLTWFTIICVHLWRLQIFTRRQGEGLGAVAGGWGFLLGMPSTVMLLTAAFGAGLYLTVRWISH
jgi:hypothetical protein